MKGDKKDKKDKSKKEAVTDDPRFSSVHSDPRFNLPGRKKGRVQLDDRFKAAIADNEDFKRKRTVDKYGRKVTKDKAGKELKKYANLSDESASESKSGSEEANESESDDSDDSDSEDDTKVEKKVIDRARGEGVSDESESESESGSDSSSDDSDSSDEDDDDEVEGEFPDIGSKENIPTGDESRRFACVNMDWDNIRAVDLMATFSSFVPPRGRILSIKIIPSEYGREQMAREAQEGPPSEFFSSKKGKKSEEEEEINEKTIVQADDGEEVSSSALRKYQLQRLQYYYAVVECDSVGTASKIYDNCDGTEYESTANFFDLRYIPDDMSFDEDDPRDTCEKIPADYRPNNFVTDALQHSKVKLTWDETPAERLKFAEKAFNQKDIDDMDLKAYIASDSEEDDETAEDTKAKYRSLLGGIFDKNDEEDGNMEITFTPGLEDGEEEAGKGGEDEEESTIDRYKRKQKERKQQRLERMKEQKKAEQPAEPEKPTGKKAKKKAEAEERAKKTAELELLMMDDHLTSADVEREKRAADNKKSKKKGKKRDQEEGEINVSDPRFQAMFENPDFAVDPTAPQYKKTESMDKLMEERRRRYKAEDPTDDPKAARKKRKTQSQPADENISALVQKLKRKAKK